MAPTLSQIDLSMDELREVTRFAAACATTVLALFERPHPDDRRPRTAIEVAETFANGGRRIKALRDAAWGAHRAAQGQTLVVHVPSVTTRNQRPPAASDAAATHAARAAGHACGAAFLHPLAKATQVIHILGSAAHAVRAVELDVGDDVIAARHLAHLAELASPVVIAVLSRYPRAPAGGGRVGALIRELDARLR